ncbi:MAG: hypothetical protein EOP54_10065 [Sphingobacteriales bacterium]|nr:MAG: hypothetical protein EOP54_10065 [Sphingobacteriales bacterium]
MPKNQDCINPRLKINVLAGRKPNPLYSNSGFRLINLANDFLNAEFIKAVSMYRQGARMAELFLSKNNITGTIPQSRSYEPTKQYS